MSTLDENERREYYRIEDTIALDFTPLNPVPGASHEPPHDDSPLFSLLADLHLLEFDAQHLLRPITERDRNLANYLKLTNKRIDLLGQVLAQSLLREMSTPRRVSLSEDGLRFKHSQPLALDSRLALKMVLLPQALGLQLQGTVIHCQELASGGFEIGCEFQDLPDAQRQLLARHILQKQALERRLAREQSDATADHAD
jgi:hypothetical protein